MSINNNKSYKFLFEALFQGENTKPTEILNLINDFDIYLTLFNKPSSLVQSFDAKIDKDILDHISSSNEIINDINDNFLGYIKITVDKVQNTTLQLLLILKHY